MDSNNLIKLNFDSAEVEEFKYNKNIITVRSWMGLEEQIYLIVQYVKDFLFPKEEFVLFQGSQHDPIWCETILERDILKLFTNLDVSELDFEGFHRSGLWEEITSRIQNYEQFRKNLDKVLADTKEQVYLQKSIGSSFDLIASKVSAFLDTLNEFLNKMSNISPDDVEKIKEAGKEILGDIQKSDVAQIFKEAQMQNNPVVATTTATTSSNAMTLVLPEMAEPAPKTNKRGRKPKKLVQ